MASDFNRCRHFLRGVISSTLVFEMSRLSKSGKSSVTISRPCLLKSVLLTSNDWRARNLDNATTTQHLQNNNYLITSNIIRVTYNKLIIITQMIFIYNKLENTMLHALFITLLYFGSIHTYNKCILPNKLIISTWTMS